MMTSVAILGATGYTGEELVRLLSRHPDVRITYLSGKEDREQRIQELFPYLKGTMDLPCRRLDPEEAERLAEVIILCLPHTVSAEVAPYFLKKQKRVIDVSADYRLKDPVMYKKYYGKDHPDPAHLPEAVYGLTEWNREAMRDTQLVANPGCYPTGALLALLPLVRAHHDWAGSCVIDAKSGFTGAGRKAARSFVFSEVNENFKAYKIFSHAHVPEIAQALSEEKKTGDPSFIFVPHLLPVDRGILSTIYVPFKKTLSFQALRGVYEKAYGEEFFIKLLPPGVLPEIKAVRNTNQCHLGLSVREEDGAAVIVTAIDNLGKGAAGQAVQNLNVMCGYPEDRGLV